MIGPDEILEGIFDNIQTILCWTHVRHRWRECYTLVSVDHAFKQCTHCLRRRCAGRHQWIEYMKFVETYQNRRECTKCGLDQYHFGSLWWGDTPAKVLEREKENSRRGRQEDDELLKRARR